MKERTPIEYPEHVKLGAVAGETQAAGGFLEWLQQQGMALCELTGLQTWEPTRTTIQQLLAGWKGIDRGRLEEEKRAMLEEMRRRTG